MNFFLKALIWDIVVTILFVLLVPGVLLTLPTKGFTEGYGDFETNVIATHAVIFFVLYYIVKVIFWIITKALKQRKPVGASTPVATPTIASTPTRSPTISSPPVAKLGLLPFPVPFPQKRR
jgi:hypothetical protein